MTRTALLAVRILLSTVTLANAGSLGRPCTTTPRASAASAAASARPSTCAQ